jgi:GNAT superfamily N-acetyltransferase
MSGQLTVRKIESAPDFRAFFEFPWQVYKNDPNWVPPLLSMRRDLLDKEKNPDWKCMEGDYFAAWRDNRIVGTIAAYVNPLHNQSNNEHVGWFGAFEVYDDQEAAAALLETAADWVRSRGYDAIVGPQTFTTHGDYGLLVDGFIRPVLLLPYNHPYYRKFIECAGFQKREDLYSFHASRQQAGQIGMSERLQRITQSVMRRNKITVRPIDRSRLREEFTLFKDIYNEAWGDTWGHVPMTPAELDALVNSLGRFFDPDFAFFAYVGGEPAGFVMGIPDYNQILKKAAPRPGMPEIITLLRALWYWKIRRVINWIRIALLGVKHDYRERGVDVALCGTILEAGLNSRCIEHCDCSWVGEENRKMASVAHNLGLELYKTHRLYEKRFLDSSR